jgi:hypothetical protein
MSTAIILKTTSFTANLKGKNCKRQVSRPLKLTLYSFIRELDAH